jgi:hypothetical protein
MQRKNALYTRRSMGLGLCAVVGEGSRFHYMHLQKEHQNFAAGVWHKILMLLDHSRLKSS